MSVTFGNTGAITSSSFSFTSNGTSMVIGVSSTANTVTDVSFNAVSATQIGSAVNNVTAGRFLSLWILPNNAVSGTHTLAITGGGTLDGSVVSISGLQAAIPYNVATTNSGTSATPSLSITTNAVNNAYAFGWCFSINSASAGANTTLIGGGGTYEDFWRSTNPVSPTGSITLNTSITSTEWNFIGVALNPVAPTNAGNFLSFM